MRIVFFGTSNVALPILEKLHQHHHIAAVVTQPDARVGRSQETKESPVAVLAKEMDALILKPEEVKNNPRLVDQLKQLCSPSQNPHPDPLPEGEGVGQAGQVSTHPRQTGGAIAVRSTNPSGGPQLWRPPPCQ